jgi:hypothetical protein
MGQGFIIICGQVGVGHDEVANNPDWDAFHLLPGTFLWGESTKTCVDGLEKKTEWPQNYCDAVVSLRDTRKVVLVSSHEAVVKEFVRRGIKVFLVYPDETQQDDYRQRHKENRIPPEVIPVLDSNFGKWVAEARAQPGEPDVVHIVLSQGQYLKDVMERILAA